MSITVAQARSLIEATLGGTPETAGVSAIINAAGRTLYSMHEWDWLLRPTADLGTTADQAYINLPADFGSVEAVAHGSRLEIAQWVTTHELIRWRRGDHGTPRGYVMAVATTNTAGVLAKRLELYPTPSVTDADALQLAYRAAWTEVLDATDGTVVLPIDPACELIFFDLLSAVAKGIDEDDNAPASVRIQAIRGSQAFRDAVAADVNTQPIVGMIPSGRPRHFGTSHITLLDPP